MYGGAGAETAATDAAVAATAGQVVTYQGRPAVTYFFAGSGGWTESVQNVCRGTLCAIDVTHHGVSPRIVSAVVVGSRGRTTVGGAQLQGALGPAGTDATFAIVP